MVLIGKWYEYGSIPININMAMDQYLWKYHFNRGMNVHKSQLNFDVNYRGTRFWHTAIYMFINIPVLQQKIHGFYFKKSLQQNDVFHICFPFFYHKHQFSDPLKIPRDSRAPHYAGTRGHGCVLRGITDRLRGIDDIVYTVYNYMYVYIYMIYRVYKIIYVYIYIYIM